MIRTGGIEWERENMKRYLALLLAVLLLASCGKTEEADQGGYQIYYVNKEGTALTHEGYDPQATDTDALIGELLEQMNTAPEDASMRVAKPDGVTINGYSVESAFIYMDFGPEYQTMNVVTEVLYRAAVVKTLTQIPGIEGVSFQVAGTPLSDQRGNAVGVMTDDSFVENTGETINAYSRDTLTLYFASEDGTHLRQERVDVVYNSNMSMEKLIMEQLIAGPQAEGYRAVLPADVTVLSISVSDGTCYVNFDGKLQNIEADITEDVALYAIVDSLTELSSIRRVQIAINGETQLALRESRRLDQPYVRNLDLLEE